jgi:CRISPR-associated endonuclease/helicase Cas3
MDHEDFRKLTGYEPFPWQEALYKRFVAEKGNAIPRVVSLPTGLGKTNVIAVWLLALANGADLPRRLVYVVNRRTVVDQTTTEVERLRHNLPQLKRPSFDTLAISTLRGQFADNREWSADPSKPAVICGTVDMIGSRLLFSGYGVGYKAKPLHAGFLGQDVLLVHDEAHLEPAFQTLIDTIRREQDRCKDFTRFHIMELTATTRSGSGQDTTAHFTLGQKDRKHSVVKQRLEATKHLHLTQAKDDAKVAQEIADVGLKRRRMNDDNGDTHAAVLIFVRTLDDVKKISEKLANNKTGVGPDCVQQLTGTMRGLERDRMADPRGPNASRVFARFLKPPKNDAPQSERWKVEPMPGTVYLVCTSAGEVGIDISADHMVCDLSTFDSMAQRLGRVNRYGERSDTRIDVVHPASFGKKEKRTGELQADAIDKRREETLQLLRTLNGDASPKALGELAPAARQAAFAPEPVILPATDILFDAWSMTSIRKPMPGRPPVEPYLHGIRDWEPPETHVAWREEVEVITGDLLETYPPADLLDDYPLKPHELLRDRSDRVFKQLEALWQRHASKPAWLIDDRGTIEVMTLDQLTDKQRKDRINGRTVLLSPSAGGLSGGMLDGASDHADDVADAAIDEQSRVIRQRTWDPATNPHDRHPTRCR